MTCSSFPCGVHCLIHLVKMRFVEHWRDFKWEKLEEIVNFLPNLLKCCGGALINFIMKLFTTVWREQHVPAD